MDSHYKTIINDIVNLSSQFDINYKSNKFVDAQLNVTKMEELVKTVSDVPDPDIIAIKELIDVSKLLLLKANEKPTLNKSQPTLLNFYLGKSMESQNFLPVWKSLKSNLLMLNLHFNTFSIDASNNKYTDIVKRYNVNKFPTIVVIRLDGKSVHYDGELNVSKIINFLTKI